jgi:hypothetical protein
MNTLVVGVFCTLTFILDVLTLAAVGRFIRDHHQTSEALISAHNIVANRISELHDAVVNGIDAVASFTAGKSSQEGDGR